MPNPLFSIIIPTFNRPRQLARCLEALDHLDTPTSDFEVLVVDDGSPDSQRAAAALKDDFPSLALTVLLRQHGGPARARNRGAEAASGRLIAFLDDDCRPAPDWLGRLEEALDGGNGRLAGGRVVNALAEDRCAEATQALMTYLYGYYLEQRRPFFASCNMALERQRFLELGGFDTQFPLAGGEDREFCRRCRREGLELVYAAGAVVRHHHALTLRSFLRQHFNYGRGAMFYHRLRREGGRAVGTEPPSFYLGLLRHPFADPECRRPGTTALLLGLAQVATAAGYLRERISLRATRP